MDRNRIALRLILGFACACAVGCQSSVQRSNTSRTGSEQLLLSSVVDATVQAVDFRPIAGSSVFLDTSNVEVAGKDYLTYRLRERMADFGIRLQPKAEEADLIVECGAAAIGTDSDHREVGVSGQTRLPNLALSSHDRQYGVAQISMFAYERESGYPVWKSGPLRADSSWQAVNVLGSGPRYSGTIDHPATRRPRFGLLKVLHRRR